ncbi:uncharacterized protein LOC127857556 isoform X2 [Dreissena polymorpha]|uniref:Caspase recruitment domain-containing protein n=1 Tax=Dreissena polymorpha TaxID=45954 RepID=A0A9D3YZP9_DREPO|nr:uncharacterized protein LOC127857556 isoform X2 [Dreissena polymorpha]KAH3707712.1 hypothetical protein DPMN_067123 [Dreissena polymorpha]
MNESDRKLFQAIYLRFVERVDPSEMLGYITCLPEHTRDIIRNSQTCYNGSRNLAAQKLFEALKCRPDGLQNAASALRQCKCEDLANELQHAPGQHNRVNPGWSHRAQEPMAANLPPVGANYSNVLGNYHAIQMADASTIQQNQASFRPNETDRNEAPYGSNRYPNSYASPGYQNQTPRELYVPGRDTVPNSQYNGMSASYPGASNVGLPRPTWSMSQGPQQGLYSLQQQPVYQHQSFRVEYDRSSPSAHSAPAMSEFPNNLQGNQAAQNVGDKEPSMESFKMYRSQSTGTVIEEKNDLNRAMSFTELLNTAISDTDNEDSDSDFTEKKNIEQEENNSSLPESNASKIINNQENAEFRQTLTNNEVGIEKQESLRNTEGSFEYVPGKPQATGFDSSETTLKHFDNPKGSVTFMDNNPTRAGFDSSEVTRKSPITDDEHKDSSNVDSTIQLSLRSEAVKNKFETEITQEHVENIRECFSDVYSQTASLLPSAPEVSTESTANVEATQQRIDHSLEDARIPEMRILRDDAELKSIMKKGGKANAFGIPSYRKDCKTEDWASFTSDSEESGSAVNSDEEIISADGIPTTGYTARAKINGMNEYFEQLNDHPKDLTKDQTKNNNVQKSITAMRPEVAENVNADNLTDERLTPWLSFGSSLASLIYKGLHPDV